MNKKVIKRMCILQVVDDIAKLKKKNKIFFFTNLIVNLVEYYCFVGFPEFNQNSRF